MPDTTPPRVTNNLLARSPTVNYTVPVGSGAQLQTVPLAPVTQIDIALTESASNFSTSHFLVTSAITGVPYPITVATGGSAQYTIILSTPITTKDKVVVTVLATLKDDANNNLDGDWDNPSSVNTTTSDVYDSGNGSAGGDFNFRFIFLPGDFNRNNMVEGNDFLIWQRNLGKTSGATFEEGDANGDGAVNAADKVIWTENAGTDWTNW